MEITSTSNIHKNDIMKNNIEFFNDNFNFIKDNFDFIKNNFENIKKILTIIQINNTSNKNNSKLNNNSNYDKKINIKCKYGTTCCNDNCKRIHPIGWSAEDSRMRLSKITCKFGDNCKNIKNCLYFHKNLNNTDNQQEKKTYAKCVSISPLALKPIDTSSISSSSSSNSYIDSSYNNNRYRSLSMNSNSSISAKPEQNYISINIAYIANGWGHNDRTPCWIVLSDFQGNIIFDEKINPLLSKTFCDITSTLEPLTGITMDILEKEGKSYNEIITNISEILNSETVLVGHNVDTDILRLGLQTGKHYKNYIDLSMEFRTARLYGSKIKHKYFSINQEKYALLDIKEENNDIIEDTKYSMILFKNWIKPGDTKKNRAIRKLVECKYSFDNDNNFIIDGVCCSPYRKDKCICNQ